MRITTKLFAFITLLVALGMFLMLLGSTYSFYSQTHQRTEIQLNILTVMIDRQLLSEPRDEVKRWLPVMMRSVGAIIPPACWRTIFRIMLPYYSQRRIYAAGTTTRTCGAFRSPDAYSDYSVVTPLAGATAGLSPDG